MGGGNSPDPDGSRQGPAGAPAPAVPPDPHKLSAESLAARPANLVEQPFDVRRELTQVLYNGVNHSVIHNPMDNLSGAVPMLGFLADNMAQEFPPRFPVEVRDPREAGHGGPAWSVLSPPEKVQVLAQEAGRYREVELLRGDKTFDLDVALRFFKRYEGILESLTHAFNALPEHMRKDETGDLIERNIGSALRIMRAQIDLGTEPAPNFESLQVRNLVAEAAGLRFWVGITRIDESKASRQIPENFIQAGEMDPRARLLNGQYDLLLRTIAECAKNTFYAAYLKERAALGDQGRLEEPPDSSLLGYKMIVSTHLRPDGSMELRMRDNAGGIPEKYLAPDTMGIPDRPYMCNRTTSSKGSGIGTCELYHVAKLHGARLEISNYSEGGLTGAQISIIFPASAVSA